VEKIRTHILCSVILFIFEKFVVCETMLKNIVQPGRPHVTIWRMHIACWMPKCTNTHSECIILIAFPQQQWLHERASMLRYTCIACIVNPGSKWKWLDSCTLWLLYSSVSQPPDRGPVPGPGINYTGPREAWGNYNMLQDFISPVDN